MAVQALVKQFRQIVNVHITQIFQVQARLKGDLNNHREKKHDSDEEIHNSQSSSCPKCDQYLTWITGEIEKNYNIYRYYRDVTFRIKNNDLLLSLYNTFIQHPIIFIVTYMYH